MRIRALGGVAVAAASLVAGVAVLLAARDDLEREFKARCQELRATMLKGTSEDVLGQDGWVVVVSELRYAAGGPFWGMDGPAANPKTGLMGCDPVPAILDFQRQLARRGIQLIFMPVPTRIVVHPEAVLGRAALAGLPRVPHLHSPETEFYRLLRGKGVEVVDLTPIFLQHRDDPHGPLFVPSETHWTPYGVAVGVQEVGRLVKKQPWYAGVARSRYETTWEPRAWRGHVYRDLHDKAGLPDRPPDRLWMRTVRRQTPDGPVRVQMRNPDSPVLVLGDSNSVFWFEQESSLPHQLAAELGFDVDILSTTGGGSTNTRVNLARTAQATPGYLESKKVVVWCLASRTFRDSSWWRIPIDKAPVEKSEER